MLACMEAKGANGTVTFDGQVIRITRGTFSRQGKGEKVIPLASVGAVQLRKPSFGAILADGAWSVSVLGEAQGNQSRRGRGSARREGMHDENTVLLEGHQVGRFEALTRAINEAKAAPPAPVVVQAPAPPAQVPAPDMGREQVIAQLRQLGDMNYRGVLDDAAFIKEMHVLLPRL